MSWKFISFVNGCAEHPHGTIYGLLSLNRMRDTTDSNMIQMDTECVMFGCGDRTVQRYIRILQQLATC